jgi:hypothetical protein
MKRAIVTQIWDAVADHGIDCSTMSWSDHTVFGDQSAITEVIRLLDVEVRFKALMELLQAAQREVVS